MVSKNNRYLKETKQGTKVESYSIKKFKVGAASVVIGASIFFGVGAVAQASEDVANNTLAENTTNADQKSTELPKPISKPVVENTKESVASAVATKVEEKVDKKILKDSIAVLEEKLKSAQDADKTAVETAREVLEKAKVVLASKTATKEEVDEQVKTVQALSTVVTEAKAHASEKKLEEKKEKEEQAIKEEKEVAEIKKELKQVVSEAEVTNVLANEAIRKNEVNNEVKAKLERVMTKNQDVFTEIKILLAEKNITKEQLDAQVERLNESMLAVYTELKNAGIGRDGKFAVALSAQDFYAEKDTNVTHASEINAANHTGTDTYTIPIQEITLTKGAGTDTSGLEVVVYSNQREGDETNAGNGMHTEQGGTRGHNNTGRVDYPLTPEAAKKLAEEAPLWRNKLRADGSKISNAATAIYSAGGGYEYLATEIYGYGYEQGIDRVYIKGLKDRIAVTETAKQAGWSLTSVTPTNLVPGLTYDEATDTIQGVVSANIENGVYDLRFDVTATNKDGRSVSFRLQNLRAGWVGWKDSIPPKIKSDEKRYERTVGDDANINIRFADDSGAGVIPSNTAGNYNYTTAEGKVITVRKNFSPSVTGVSGYNTTGATLDDSKVLIPGTNYTVSNSTPEEQAATQTLMGKGVIGGELTEAGIYTVSVFAKDYDKLANNNVWNQSGQEVHAALTVVVKPKVEVQNVETYSTSVPVKISKGATSAKVTMPDGTVTNLKAVNGKWLVASDSTNTAVTENQELGAVDSNTVFNIPVTSEATAKAGVDNITVEASSENVKGTFLREQVELTGTDGQKHTATLNSETGHWQLPAEYAEVRTVNADGTTTWTKRQVYTEAQQDGGMKFYIYEYTRQLDENGKVTSVETPTRPLTTYVSQNTDLAGNGMSVTITYDKHSNTWTSSDGTKVTATKVDNNSWEVHTESGFGGVIKGTIATNTDVATVVNTKPTATSQDYTSTKGTAVDLRNEAKAAVTISDVEDTKYGKTTYITRITVISPSGVKKVYDTKQDASNYNLASGYTLNEVGVYTVTVDVVDSNGNYTTEATIGGIESGIDHGEGSSTASTTYHITVTDSIEGHNVTSTDIQGVTQTGTPNFTSVGDGSPVVPSATSPAKLVNPTSGELVDEVTINGQGTYTINNATGVVTFVPLNTFIGTATPVTVSLTTTFGQDLSGNPITATATATYTPTVTEVVPTAKESETKDIQGAVQKSPVVFDVKDEEDKSTVNFDRGDERVELNKSTLTLVNAAGEKVNEVVIANEGKYVLKDGVIEFTPEKQFVGKATSVTVQVEDVNGKVATTKYTPEVVGVQPTATPAETTDIQGVPQKGLPEFLGGRVSINGVEKIVPIDETKGLELTNPETGEKGDVITVPGEGKYEVNNGVVVFTPEPQFTGKAKGINVTRVDMNGTPVTAKYTPTVTPIKPTGENVTSTDIQGKVQEGTPVFTEGDKRVPIEITDKKPAKFIVGGKEVDVTEIPATKEGKEVGKYTLDKNTGKVTFTPNKDFIGTPDSATVQVQDKNGTPATATYTPTVTPVKPTGENVTSTDIQGKVQTGKPEFKPGNPEVPMDEEVSATFEDGQTTKTVDKVGTYTVAKDGTVTFTPEKTFTGEAPAVTVKRVDKNGTPATATYTPTVTPVKPEGIPAKSTDIQGKVQTGKPEFKPGNPEVPMDEEVPATFEDGQTTKTVDKVGTYTVAKDGTVTFTPEKTFTGEAPAVTVKRVDKNGTPVTATYTPTVTEVVPTAKESETKDIQGAVQKSPVVFDVKDEEDKSTVNFDRGDERVELNKSTLTLVNAAGEKVNEVVIANEGKYVLKDGVIEFTPEKQFVGKATSVTVQVEDVNGKVATTKYTPEVVGVQPTATPAETTDIQGKVQTGKPEFKPGNPEVPMDEEVPATFEDGQTTKTVDKVGTYTVAKDGTVTFTPEKTFTGEAPAVTVKRVDKNGTPVTATYTPTVTEVVPTAKESETKDIQGAVQKSPVVFDVKDEEDKSTVNFDRGDERVELNKSTLTLVNAAGEKVNEVVIANEGKYVLKDGVIEFTPEKQFVGKATSVTVQVEDVNGKVATTKYTPEVVGVQPTATPAETTDIQGKVQTGKPEFKPGNPEVPMDEEVPATFEDGQTTKTVDKVGTYTVAKDGTVTFTPEKTFTGEAPAVTVKRVDKNGTPATATYTPTVTPVKPTGENVTSTDIQGKVQTGKPEFKPGNPEVPMDEEVPATFEDGQTTKTIDKVGTYTVAKDGTVTFTPEKTFTGEAPAVTVKRVDKNGTPATATYTPTVTPVKPEGIPAKSTDIQGKVQTGKPEFKPGNPEVPMDEEVPATFEDGQTTKTVDKVGTYTVAKDGTVTFTPEKTFTGEAPAVTVKRVDKNGTPVTATYTPTVTEVTPTGEVSETEGARGTVQKSPIVFDAPDQDNTTVNFNKGHEKVALDKSTLTLVDKTGKEMKEVIVPGEGTYVLKDGVIEFTPEKDFVGRASGVTVQVKDENGKVVSKTYTPTVRPITSFKDKEGNEIPKYPSEPGTVDKKDIPEYRFVETKKLPNGDTEHIYEKVNTFFKDKEGNEIPKYPSEPGTVDKKDIPEYRFVETKKLPNGDTEHVYEKVNTFFKDKEGNEIPKYPSEPGTVDKKDIPEYRFVETKKLPNGDTEHIYEKVNTFFKDKEGNEIPKYPSEPGTVDKKDIPEYRFVETKKLPNGDTEHIYEKVNTFFKDKEGNEIPKYPSEPGTVDKKDIPEYRFVETKKLPNGDTEHIYEKVNTFFKDKEGNEIPKYPSEPGTVDKKDIPEYRFVETKKLPNGDTEHIYEKVNTFFKDKEGNEIPKYPSEPGTVDKKDIPEYRFVETKKLPNGDTEHVYEKVNTFFKDKEGNEIPKYPSEPGTVDKKDIPEYRFVETKKLPNGDTEHIYEKVNTFFKDKEGNEIPKYPSEPGTVDKKDIPEYRFVETKKLPNGDTEHIYEKVNTFFKDKEGNEIPKYPSEPGTVDKKDIPEYRFVETKKLPNGDTEHIYEKVNTFFKDKEGNEIPKYPSEPGTVDKKDIPEYRFVETKKLPNGDTEHIYEKVNTFFKDKEGNEIPKYPSEPGTVDKKDIPEYRFVETKKLPNGDTEHIYEKVNTFFKDKEGNEIPKYPSEPGTVDKKDIPEYRFVESKKLPNGDTEHVYEKVKTSFKDKEGNEIPKYPSEPGTVDKKDIPEYRFVESKKLPNGDTEHIYEKVTTPTPVVEKTTSWIDENGNPLKSTEKGIKDPGSIPGYELVKTTVDSDGNKVHIFKKLTTLVPEVKEKRLANTGTTETNSSLAGLGLAILGLATARKRRRDK